MSKKNRGTKKIAFDADAEGFGHNPFAKLAGTAVVSEKADDPIEKTKEIAKKTETRVNEGLPRKVVIRCERKGRGGKTVTLIEGVEEMTSVALDQLARNLRKSFGVGSAVEQDKIVLQGDQMERLESWLQDAGVSKVVRGN